MRMNLDRELQSSEHKSAKETVKSLTVTTQANETLRRESQEKVTEYYNKKRKDMSFEKGKLVLLSSRHIRTIRASKKLADRFLGPFEILERIGQNAYKLKLPPKYSRLHHTFHVSLLEAYRLRPGCEPPDPQDIEGNEEWEVERILDDVTVEDGRKFFVRWKGCSEAWDSWEPESHLRHAPDVIAKYDEEKE
jgi:hypothetical protein